MRTEFKSGARVYNVIVSMMGPFIQGWTVKSTDGLNVTLKRELFGFWHDTTFRTTDIETCFYNTLEEAETHKYD